MNTLRQLSAKELYKAADLKERIDALQEQLNELLGTPAQAEVTEAPAAPKAGRRKRKKMSAQGRANIQAGVAKRKAKGAAQAEGKTSPKSNGELTVKSAVLKALESGQEMAKKELAQAVSELRGKKTNSNTLNPTLNQMKNKDKTIASPKRGIYQLK